MRSLIDITEEVDEVNYFLKEWKKISDESSDYANALKKPEIHFVAHSLERVISETTKLNIDLELKIGNLPVVARQNCKSVLYHDKPSKNLLIPSNTSIHLTSYKKIKTKNGTKQSYIGNNKGVISLRTLANIVTNGGELRIAT